MFGPPPNVGAEAPRLRGPVPRAKTDIVVNGRAIRKLLAAAASTDTDCANSSLISEPSRVAFGVRVRPAFAIFCMSRSNAAPSNGTYRILLPCMSFPCPCSFGTSSAANVKYAGWPFSR